MGEWLFKGLSIRELFLKAAIMTSLDFKYCYCPQYLIYILQWHKLLQRCSLTQTPTFVANNMRLLTSAFYIFYFTINVFKIYKIPDKCNSYDPNIKVLKFAY